MLNHSDVAKSWVKNRGGDKSAKGSRLFYHGETIYSYRTSWPIARFVPNASGERAVLMRTDTYSVSTGTHKRHVRSALHEAGVRVFHVYPHTSFDEVLREYTDRIKAAMEAAKKPRIRAHTRAAAVLSAEHTYQELCAFNEFYQCGWPCERDTSFEGTLARVMIERGIGGDDAR